MSAPPPQPPGGYSLFPNPNSKPPTTKRPSSRTRRSESRERSRTRAPTPGAEATTSSAPHAIDTSPPRQGRRHRQRPSIDTTVSPQTIHQSPMDDVQIAVATRVEAPIHVQRPPPVADIPPRSDTAFSEAQTLVRSNSTRSRSSIAKLPLREESSSAGQPSRPQPAIRSIFPQYNPEVSLNQQDYFPTQTSPTHIPRAVISRMTYQPEDHHVEASSPAVAQAQRWPPRNHEIPTLPVESSTEQLKNLWKVVNGWKASPSDGRVFCMKLSQEKDAPVYTLSSRQQPFYNMRLDPTSASAIVTLSRHDPNKHYKAASASTNSSASSIINNVVGSKDANKNSDSKNWQEVISTTLEEESRRHRPNDGLVALLYPAAAQNVALNRPDDAKAIAMAETECTRLVWDDDSGSHFLVHPALATPFCITIERNAAWSRTEYTLEHHESPQHLAKLTRDGTGSGWLEVDTAIAAKIESFFVVDVAVAALLLVAAGDERTSHVETFEPPPLPPTLDTASGDGRSSRLGGRSGKKSSKRKMEAFEIDVESQDGGFAKFEQVTKETRRKLPWPLRAAFKVLGGVFKCFVWCLTIIFKALAAVVVGLARCVGVK
ncbi:hypothetical protein BN1723_000679 [Verticillium longisporum]|uniref:Acetylserotonin methytransferase-like protein n=1 Tax=Verticillium longisporum TaxID=100787 RepID=A0A0G4MY56_VERLO|nr:hypothetical protein BN1723_000679 [Verticillium longisporum]